MARGRKRVAEPEEEVERVKKKLGAGGVRKEESLESHAVLAEQDDDVDGDEEVVNVKRRPGRKPKTVEGKRDSAEEEKEVLAEQLNDDGEEGKEEEVVNVNVKRRPGRKPKAVEGKRDSAEEEKVEDQPKEGNDDVLEEKQDSIEEKEIERKISLKNRLRTGGVKKVNYADDDNDLEAPVKKRGRKNNNNDNKKSNAKGANENDKEKEKIAEEKPKKKRGRAKKVLDVEKENGSGRSDWAGYSLRAKRIPQNQQTFKSNKHDPKVTSLFCFGVLVFCLILCLGSNGLQSLIVEQWIEEVSLMCHQCQRNDKGRVVRCKTCKRKRYCVPCLQNWYTFFFSPECGLV